MKTPMHFGFEKVRGPVYRSGLITNFLLYKNSSLNPLTVSNFTYVSCLILTWPLTILGQNINGKGHMTGLFTKLFAENTFHLN